MNVLILGSNRTLTLSLLRSLSGAGITAFVLASENYPVVRASRVCSGFQQFEPEQMMAADPSLAETADQLAKKHGCAAVLPSGVEAVAYLARCGDVIKSAKVVPVSSSDTILMLNNKWLFQQFACSAGVLTPAAELVTDAKDVKTSCREYPVIIKPIDADGSRGVKRLDSVNELNTYLEGLQESDNPRMILQKYIPGEDMSVSVLADHGVVQVWEVHKRVDKDLEYVYDPDAVQAASRLVAASKFHGMVNFDFIREKGTGELYFLECNPRPWASIHIAMCAGVNFAKLWVDVALGNEVPYIPPPEDTFIHPERALLKLALCKIRLRDLSPATRKGLELDRNDPFASLVRILEKHMPGFTRLMDRRSTKNPRLSKQEPVEA